MSPTATLTDPHFPAAVRLLRAAGAQVPEAGGPWTEALLLGLSGGPGLRWEITGGSLRLHLLGSPGGTRTALLGGLGVVGATVEEHAPHGVTGLGEALGRQAAAGRPVLLWTDGSLLDAPVGPAPAVILGAAAPGQGRWRVLSGGSEAERSTEELAAAREGRSPLAWISEVEDGLLDLEEDAPDIVRKTCYALLVQPARRQGLPALRRWLEALDAAREGWGLAEPAARASLFGDLHRALAHGTEGQGWRARYAAFLRELGELVDNEDIFDPAETYERAGAGWARAAALAAEQAAAGTLDDDAWARARSGLREVLAEVFELEMRATTDLQHMIY